MARRFEVGRRTRLFCSPVGLDFGQARPFGGTRLIRASDLGMQK